MRKQLLILFAVMLFGCSTSKDKEAFDARGSWLYVWGISIEKGDTTFTDYTRGHEGIKIITDTHFSFLIHDRSAGKDSAATFIAGGGRAVLEGARYIEYLDYCNYRDWEGNRFEFEVTLKGDTLVQTGTEKVVATNTERLIIETYVRSAGRGR